MLAHDAITQAAVNDRAVASTAAARTRTPLKIASEITRFAVSRRHETHWLSTRWLRNRRANPHPTLGRNDTRPPQLPEGAASFAFHTSSGDVASNGKT